MELDRRKQMQKEQSPEKERTAFTSLQKGRALLILLDYSERTGKKWSAICSEIMRLVGDAATLEAPLLTRQDLEAWASGRSLLGDEKFALVYGFLTHPKTLARSEFSKANNIFIEERLSAYATSLRQVVGEDGFLGVQSDETHGAPAIELQPNDLNRFFLIERHGRTEFLYLSFEKSINAYLCHLFVPKDEPNTFVNELSRLQVATEHAKTEWQHRLYLNDGQAFMSTIDWAVERYSGIGIFGNPTKIFLRGVEKNDAIELEVSAAKKPEYKSRIEDRLWLVDRRVSSFVAEYFADQHANVVSEAPKSSQVGVDGYFCRAQDMYIRNLDVFFADFRWNVGL